MRYDGKLRLWFAQADRLGCITIRSTCASPLRAVATLLTHALLIEAKVLALTVTDPESILRALDDPPTDALAELRGVLLAEHEWRVREGLVQFGRVQAGPKAVRSPVQATAPVGGTT